MGESRSLYFYKYSARLPEQRSFPALSLTRSVDSTRSSNPTTPKSSYIATLAESPVSPLAARSSSPGRPATQSRPPSQLRTRETRPPYLPFRRISLPSVPNHKRDSVASVFSVDSVQEREEQDDVPHGMVSASLPTESSMPDIGPLSPPPPLPVSGSSATSSPSRRGILLAPTSPPVTPTRVRPRPMSANSARTTGQNQGRSGLVRRGSRRPMSKTQIGVRDMGREDKRRNVLREWLDTEQTYVEGLDLVYNVSQLSPRSQTCSNGFSIALSRSTNRVPRLAPTTAHPNGP